jgi:hypothetical protein
MCVIQKYNGLYFKASSREDTLHDTREFGTNRYVSFSIVNKIALRKEVPDSNLVLRATKKYSTIENES